MALQFGALRDALTDAGASPEKADKAAEEVSAFYTSQRRSRSLLQELPTAILWMLLGATVALTAVAMFAAPHP